MNPLVSVIIPVYNAQPYLRECLDSVVSQTLEDIEIICVDDGSTDDSLDILREYENRDSRVKVLTQPNINAGAARNRGLEIARGKYLSFLDADDFFESDMLESCCKKLDDENADIVCFAAKQYDVSTGLISEMPWSLRTEFIPDKGAFSPEEIAPYIFNSFQNWTWNKLFRHDYIKENGIRFQEIPRTNDMLFTYAALVMAKRIAVIERSFVMYRVGTGTSLQQTNRKHPTAFWGAYTETKRFLVSKGKYELYEQSFLNSVLPGSFYNLLTINELQAYIAIYYLIKYRGETEFHFSDYGRGFYYSEDYSSGYYGDYLKMLEQEILPVKDAEPLEIELNKKVGEVTAIKGELNNKIGEISELTAELNKKTEDLTMMETSLTMMKADRDKQAKKLNATETKLRSKTKELERLRASTSFRIGRIITWLPRMIRRGITCFRKRGFAYTWGRILVRLHIKEDPAKNVEQKP